MSDLLDIPAPSAASEVSTKSATAFKTISEVSTETGVPQHVLRFWEAKFSQLRPLKRGGGRRYYRPEDVALLMRIRRLLHDEGYTIKGVQKVLRDKVEEAVESVTATPLPTSPIPRPSSTVFPRTRMAMASGEIPQSGRLVLDVELLGSRAGRERLLLDVLEELRQIRSHLEDR
jgi:DNA-binding transcriptional MerR regulator